jgi:3-keto-disaccharide hydrolase
MKRGAILPGLASLTLLASACSCAWAASTADANPLLGPFLGRWDITLQTPQREFASWLEISQDNGELRARMVGRWGHARLLPHAELVNGGIRLVSPKEEEGTATDMIFEGRLSGSSLVGTTSASDGTVWTWRGERAPTLERTRAARWGKPITLFNGRDLSGWRMIDQRAQSVWQVRDGTLISPARGPDLLSDARFEDFKLHIEFMCAPGSNSGVYLRGRYEVQIEDDPNPEPANWGTGSIYGFLAPSPPAPRQPAQWHAFDLTLIGRRVTVVLDGRTVIADREIPGITGGALDSHEALPGPIYLQGSEEGRVSFRNIVVRRARAGG